MTTIFATLPRNGSSATSAPRVVSIDIFRGLTMAVMIFVNQLSGVQGLPWWTYHAHAQQDLMTYVDMVFPFFLFIVGISMPLSVAQRLKRNPSIPGLWGHVLLRVLGLLVLGLILANAEACDPAQMHIGGALWAVLALLSAGLYLNVYPKSEAFPAYPLLLRAVGLIGVFMLLAIFRRATPDGKGGLDRFFISGDTWPHRPHLFCRKYSLHSHAAIELDAARVAYSARLSECIFDGKTASISESS
jgi:predicted acyltransferase